jgi:DNA-binding response OmpR family regulator
MSKRVLLIDDEPHAVEVLKAFLSKAGYVVETARNGEEGLQKQAEAAPDVIITDAQMPRLNGMQLCEQLRLSGALDCLVIMMTSRTDRDIRSWVQEFKDIQLMEKPLSPRSLVRYLDQYFEGHRQPVDAA